MKTDNRGFSLVELVVVIAIMAILVGVLAPQFIKYVDRSRMATDVQNLQNVCRVIEAYAADFGNHGETIPEVCSFTISDTADISSPDVYLNHAFENQAIIKDFKLKSSAWFSSSNSSHQITINVSDLGKGMPTFSETRSELNGNLSIINGILNK